MKSDVILNKVAIIERCIRRINEEYQQNPQNLENNTKQDSIILNLQRACEASIYLAMHIVADKGWGFLKIVEMPFHYWKQRILSLLFFPIG